ncbi:unnamed protein product [Ectocarpus sp. CCAP 1310/34]|nr:unnamed protein product [Ectocarpus sp. CCAP 1310/34]
MAHQILLRGTESGGNRNDLTDCISVLLAGGARFCAFNTKAKRSPCFPYENDRSMGYSCTRHNRKGFDVDDIRHITAKHFYGRRRAHHPLLEVVETFVPSSKDNGTSVPVDDIPCNLLVNRKIQSPSFIETCVQNSGGKVLRAEEAEPNGLSSNHLCSVPTEPAGNALSTSMHGRLARSSPFFGFDGLLGARTSNRKVYVNDVVMVTMSDGNTVPVWLLEWYWDMEQATLLVAVRRFRIRNEVRDVEGGERIEGLVRVWEEKGTSSKVILHSTTIQDLCEIYTREEVSR